MRSEEEMLELILNVAKNDKRIRAVLLTGSRANPSAPRDAYQDYDITYFVKDVTPFTTILTGLKNIRQTGGVADAGNHDPSLAAPRWRRAFHLSDAL